jgi:hypothetical protein
MHWFLDNRPHLAGNMASVHVPGEGERRLLSIVTKDKLRRVLDYMLDEAEFLSDYGVRSLSKVHQRYPYTIHVGGRAFEIAYEPAESQTALFGGNSNWRGPVWFPINFLLVESLQKFHHYFGDEFRVEYPTGSGNEVSLDKVATGLSRRLVSLFLRDEAGNRPVFGEVERLQEDPYWRDYVLFHEYFHGDSGVGLGASHQTGWTGLVAKLIHQSGGTVR